jgi:hypothetical protein
MTPWLYARFFSITTAFLFVGLINVHYPFASSEENVPELVNGSEVDEASEDAVVIPGLVRHGRKRIGRFRRKEDLTAILFPGASAVRLDEFTVCFQDSDFNKINHLLFVTLILPNRRSIKRERIFRYGWI